MVRVIRNLLGFVVVASVATIAGCSSTDPHIFLRENVSFAQYKKDASRCYDGVEGAAQRATADLILLGPVGSYGSREQQYRQESSAWYCMRSRGYTALRLTQSQVDAFKKVSNDQDFETFRSKVRIRKLPEKK